MEAQQQWELWSIPNNRSAPSACSARRITNFRATMIITCHHLREIGIIEEKFACCPDCHGGAGLVEWNLPAGHT